MTQYTNEVEVWHRIAHYRFNVTARFHIVGSGVGMGDPNIPKSVTFEITDAPMQR